MATTQTITYSFVQVQRDRVLTTATNNGFNIHVIKIEDGTEVALTDNLTIAQIREYVATTDYIYYYIRKNVATE